MPVFVNTKDLVRLSLGIEGQSEGPMEDLEEMEVSYVSDPQPQASSSTGPSMTHGLSSYYNVSEEDEQVRSITNEYLEGNLQRFIQTFKADDGIYVYNNWHFIL